MLPGDKMKFDILLHHSHLLISSMTFFLPPLLRPAQELYLMMIYDSSDFVAYFPSLSVSIYYFSFSKNFEDKLEVEPVKLIHWSHWNSRLFLALFASEAYASYSFVFLPLGWHLKFLGKVQKNSFWAF